METIDKILIQNNATNILIHWQEIPFAYSISIVWRGIYFSIHIKAFKIEFGSTRIITFKYRGEEYPCSLTKWKYSGGGNGIYPPYIETESYSLKIGLTFNSIELIDNLKNNNEKAKIEANPFFLLYQS